jgi:hypothetical protein
MHPFAGIVADGKTRFPAKTLRFSAQIAFQSIDFSHFGPIFRHDAARQSKRDALVSRLIVFRYSPVQVCVPFRGRMR